MFSDRLLAVGCRDRSLARGAAATALGLDVADFIFGADGSIGASLCAAGAGFRGKLAASHCKVLSL